MAFPVVSYSNTSAESANVPSHNIVLPATCPTGSLILIQFEADGVISTITPPLGFTSLFTDVVLGAAYFVKIADGTEGGTTVVASTNNNQTSAHITRAITNWYGDLAGVQIESPESAATSPPEITALWGSDDNLFIACMGYQADTISVSSYPTNYTSSQLSSSDGGGIGGGAYCASATRNLIAATDDPDDFEIVGTANFHVATIVVRPVGEADIITSASINAAGDTLTLASSEVMITGDDGEAGFELSTGEVLSYISGEGASTLVFSISPVISSSDTPTLEFYPPTDGWQDTSGNLLAGFTSTAITNNSTVGLVLSSSPILLVRDGASGDIVVNNPATTPTIGNTVLRIGGATGPILTLGTITGSGPYTIPVSVPLAAAIQNGQSLTFHVTIDAETIEGGSCTLQQEAGYSSRILTDPITDGDESVLYGYTGDEPVTNDQVVYESLSSPSGIAVDVSATGIVTFDAAPTVTQTISRYVIQVDGTIGAEADFIYEIVSGGGDVTPDTFSFTDLTDQPRSTTVESDAITVTGVDAATNIPVTITGGQYAVNSGSGYGSWISTGTNVQLGYLIKARNTTSSSYSTAVDTTLTVGGVSDTFTTTTRAAIDATIAPARSVNIAVGETVILAPIVTGDGPFTWSLSGTDAALASINVSNGVITLNDPAELSDTFDFIITVEGVSTVEDTQALTVTAVELATDDVVFSKGISKSISTIFHKNIYKNIH